MLTGSPLANALAAEVRDMIWHSESERPLRAFCVEAAGAPLDAAAIAELAGAPSGIRIDPRELAEQIERHLMVADPFADSTMTLRQRHERLLALFRQHLADPVAIRLGRVEVRVLLVGVDVAGNLVGLETIAIET